MKIAVDNNSSIWIMLYTENGQNVTRNMGDMILQHTVFFPAYFYHPGHNKNAEIGSAMAPAVFTGHRPLRFSFVLLFNGT